MADQAALFGLVGALGGAVLGAGAAITSPVLTQRYARRERERARQAEEFHRLLGLRRATRKVQQLLDPDTMIRGHAPWDAERFSDEMDAALDALRDAADQVEIYGYAFVHTASSSPPRSTPEEESLRAFVSMATRLMSLTLATSGHTRVGDRPSSMYRERPTEMFERLQEHRRQLLGSLVERMETLKQGAR
ncbi:hypothetical protein OG890_00130 [Streptomyces anulatus]|uniref:hypothetical protein n=1 Tax=Streptomyces anulatus TaxID=1892 RepID=UPI002251AA07|nr:hypothetical protein [Streptomyces anulatus]MCX4482367.1 hypothetical protein [Streptomyces anulatus]